MRRGFDSLALARHSGRIPVRSLHQCRQRKRAWKGPNSAYSSAFSPAAAAPARRVVKVLRPPRRGRLDRDGAAGKRHQRAGQAAAEAASRSRAPHRARHSSASSLPSSTGPSSPSRSMARPMSRRRSRPAGRQSASASRRSAAGSAVSIEHLVRRRRLDRGLERVGRPRAGDRPAAPARRSRDLRARAPASARASARG